VTDADGKAHLVSLADGGSRLIALPPDDRPLQWTADGKSLYVRRAGDGEKPLPVEVYTFDLATGAKRPWRSLTPADLVGVGLWYGVSSILITPDGRWYAYYHGRMSSDLYVVEGLR